MSQNKTFPNTNKHQQLNRGMSVNPIKKEEAMLSLCLSLSLIADVNSTQQFRACHLLICLEMMTNQSEKLIIRC